VQNAHLFIADQRDRKFAQRRLEQSVRTFDLTPQMRAMNDATARRDVHAQRFSAALAFWE
jgi:hypothetical protein